jgi:flagellar protein FlaJ
VRTRLALKILQRVTRRGTKKQQFNARDIEVSFAMMLITILASCGISPYESFKKLQTFDIIPFIQMEAQEIVRKVEALNIDPLRAMLERADDTASEIYGTVLRGYVSTVRSGGSVASYLNSALHSIFDLQADAARRSIERLETLVEAYMVMLLVLLCTYILTAVMSSSEILSSSLGMTSGMDLVNSIIFFVMPLSSVLFMFFAHRNRRGTLLGLKSIYMKAFYPSIVCATFLLLAMFVPSIATMVENIGVPIIITGCLVTISVPPMIAYRRIRTINFKAEESMPSFLRDVNEARKTGMSPEKSIIHGARRKGYGAFSEILTRIVNQIEWGVPIKRVFLDVRTRIQSHPVIMHFLILIETIEVGGASPDTLELLATYSEKIRDTEKNIRSMLKPYIILPFIWSVLMAVTFIFTISVITQIPVTFMPEPPLESIHALTSLLSSAIIFQCWLSGFFVGKATQGTFAAGFEFSGLLAIVTLASILASQNLVTVFLETFM